MAAQKATAREWLAVAAMAATAFVFNTSEFMPIGLLVDIAASFSITEASAGTLITAYAWAVCILSLPLMIFGVAGICGSCLFSRLYEGERRRFWFIRIALGGITVALLVMLPAACAGTAGAYTACILWGVCATAFNVAFQSEILRYAPHNASAVAMSIFSGIFNLGIGGGSAIGGVVVVNIGMSSVCLAGGVIGIAAVTLACAFLIPALRKTPKAGQGV